MNELRLGNEKIGKLFIINVLPAVSSMVISGVQTIIDGFFLGRFIGKYAMAAMSMVQPYMALIYALAFVVCIGSASKMGRSLGEGDSGTAQSVFRTSVVFLVIGLSAIGVIGIIFSETISKLLGAGEILGGYVSDYIFIISFFLPIIGNMFMFGFSTRVIGKPNMYLLGSIACIATNILLDYLFVAKFNFGLKGAAAATGLAYFASLLVSGSVFLSKKQVLGFSKGKINFKNMLAVCYNGASEAVNNISAGITIFLYNIVLMKLVGEEGVSAYTLIAYATMIATFIIFGVSDGINPIVSYNYGHKKPDRVRKTMMIAIISNFTAGAVIFVLFQFFGKNLVEFFLEEGENNLAVIEMATRGVKISSYAFFGMGFNILISTYFTAIGNALYSIIIALCRGLIFIVACLFIFSYVFGINGVWVTVPVTELLTIFVCVILLAAARKVSVKQIHS